MMGTETPVVSDHKATQHYAGDVVNFPKTLQEVDRNRMSYPVEKNPSGGIMSKPSTNAQVIPLKPEFK